MGDEPTKPAATGGFTNEQLTAAITAAMKPLTDKIAALEGNLNTVATEMATAKKEEAARLDATKIDPKAKGEPLTSEAVAKIVADGIAADRKAQAEATSKSDAAKAAKAKVVAEKLGGDADLGAFLPDTDDATQLNAAADKLAAKTTPKAKVPGTSAEGGTPVARQPVDYSKLNASQKVQMGVDQLIAGATV